MTAGRRDQLASALAAENVTSEGLYPWEAKRLAKYLEPVVDRMIRQAQAEALESAADLADVVPMHAAEHLRDRAAALRLTTDHPDVTQDGP